LQTKNRAGTLQGNGLEKILFLFSLFSFLFYLYYEAMAVKKTGYQKNKSSGRAPAGNTSGKTPVSVVLWILLFIVLISLIFILLPAVKKSRISFAESRGQPEKPPAASPENPLPEQPVAGRPTRDNPETAQIPQHEGPFGEEPQAGIQPETPEETGRDGPESGETEIPPVLLEPSQTAAQPPERPAVETRDRAVYFMQLDGDDNILYPVKVTRKLELSSSPLRDSLNALLAGPTAEEKRRGLDSFVPQRSVIRSVEINGNTAVINFNDAFQYNTLGREGCEAQLKQIVWTATEFPNVHNVQILIEGQKIDFISEGINILYPIGRQ